VNIEEELDSRMMSRYTGQISSVRMSELEYLYFVDGQLKMQFSLKVQGHSFHGMMVSVEEFDCEKKLWA
jgi:hypothetical protein